LESPSFRLGRHCNSENTRLRNILGREPKTRLIDSLISTYRWIEAQVTAAMPERQAAAE